jgi:hypothetical protein
MAPCSGPQVVRLTVSCLEHKMVRPSVPYWDNQSMSSTEGEEQEWDRMMGKTLAQLYN